MSREHIICRPACYKHTRLSHIALVSKLSVGTPSNAALDDGITGCVTGEKNVLRSSCGGMGPTIILIASEA